MRPISVHARSVPAVPIRRLGSGSAGLRVSGGRDPSWRQVGSTCFRRGWSWGPGVGEGGSAREAQAREEDP